MYEETISIAVRNYIEKQPKETMNYAIPAYALVPGGKRDRQVMMAGYKQGKGSVQFPLDKPLPADLIMRMVRYRRDMLREVSL